MFHPLALPGCVRVACIHLEAVVVDAGHRAGCRMLKRDCKVPQQKH